MTAAFDSQLKIPGFPEEIEYHELYPFSIIKDIDKDGKLFNPIDMVMIICPRDWARYKCISIDRVTKITGFLRGMEDRQTPEEQNYLASYNNNIEDPQSYKKRYLEISKDVRTAYLNLTREDNLLLAWSLYWANGVSADKIMDVISKKREARGEGVFEPRSDLIDTHLRAFICYWGKVPFREDFLLGRQDKPVKNHLIRQCERDFRQLLPKLNFTVK
ncbi:MAG: hypothetical protein Q9205_003886 [Flavoplaca limonia]